MYLGFPPVTVMTNSYIHLSPMLYTLSSWQRR